MEPMRWPNGLAEIKEYFGDPTPEQIVGDSLRVLDSWPREQLVYIPLPEPLTLSWGEITRRVGCHRLVAASLSEILREIHRMGFWEDLNPWGGCYCFRAKSGDPRILSTHSWAIAVDARVTTNRRGTRGDMPPWIVESFESRGWVWGGRWAPLHSCDPMHFQACSGY